MTAIQDGNLTFPIDGIGRDVSSAAVSHALTNAFLAPDVLPISITTFVVDRAGVNRPAFAGGPWIWKEGVHGK